MSIDQSPAVHQRWPGFSFRVALAHWTRSQRCGAFVWQVCRGCAALRINQRLPACNGKYDLTVLMQRGNVESLASGNVPGGGSLPAVFRYAPTAALA
jgi:hypothetical protein